MKTASVHPLAAVPETDEQLVDEVIAGAAPRFESLMRRHNQRVFRTARAILKDDAEAEDASQQAWLSTYQHLSQWDRRARFSTWLTRIVVHESLRRLKRAGRGGLELVEDRGASREPSPEDETTRAEMRALLERAIDGLPDGFRVVLVLRDLEELTSAEVGETLGLTEEAVRVRLHRARRALRGALEAAIEEHAGELFPFLGARCDRICASVLSQIGG